MASPNFKQIQKISNGVLGTAEIPESACAATKIHPELLGKVQTISIKKPQPSSQPQELSRQGSASLPFHPCLDL